MTKTARNRKPENNVKGGVVSATGSGSADADVCDSVKLQNGQAAYVTNIRVKGVLNVQQPIRVRAPPIHCCIAVPYYIALIRQPL